jgi:hypothetical protein
MIEIKYIPYIQAGFSISQLLGLLNSAFNLQAALIPYLIMLIACAIPSLMYYSEKQSESITHLPPATVFACFLPFLIGACISTLGLLIGIYIGL